MTSDPSLQRVIPEVAQGPSFLAIDIGVASGSGPTNPIEEREIRPWGASKGVPGEDCKVLQVKLDLVDPNRNLSHQSIQILQPYILIGVISTPQTLDTSSITNVLQIMDSSTTKGMLNAKIHAGSVNIPLRWLLSKGRVSAILNRTTYDSTYIIQTRNMNPVIMLTVASPWYNGSPRCLPSPVGCGADDSTIPIKEVKRGRVGELRDHEGTVETGEFGLSTGFGGLRKGGVNDIIIMVARVLEEGLEVGRERHRARGSKCEWGKGERSEGKDERGDVRDLGSSTLGEASVNRKNCIST